MNRGRLLLLLAVLVTLTGCKQENPITGRQQNTLEGTWTILSRDEGKGPQAAPGIKLIISPERMSLLSPSGNTKVMGDIARKDPTKTPMELDLRQGAEVGYGIYRLEGDDLLLVICDPGQPRPTTFVGTPKGMLWTLKRAK